MHFAFKLIALTWYCLTNTIQPNATKLLEAEVTINLFKLLGQELVEHKMEILFSLIWFSLTGVSLWDNSVFCVIMVQWTVNFRISQHCCFLYDHCLYLLCITRVVKQCCGNQKDIWTTLSLFQIYHFFGIKDRCEVKSSSTCLLQVSRVSRRLLFKGDTQNTDSQSTVYPDGIFKCTTLKWTNLTKSFFEWILLKAPPPIKLLCRRLLCFLQSMQ